MHFKVKVRKIAYILPVIAFFLGTTTLFTTGYADGVRDFASPIESSLLESTIIVEEEHSESFRFHGRVQGYTTLAKAFLTEGRLEKVNVVEGQNVFKGDVLASLYSPGLVEALASSDASMGKARANLDLWETELERGKKLVKNKVISSQRFTEIQNSFQLALFELKQSESDFQQIESRLDELYVIAPENGLVTHVSKGEGEILSAGESLLRFESTERQKAVFEVPEDVAVQIALGKQYEIYIPSNGVTIPSIVKEISRPSINDLPLHKITLELSKPDVELTGLRSIFMFSKRPLPVFKVDYRAIRYDINNKPFVIKKGANLRSVEVSPIDLLDQYVVVESAEDISGEVVVGSDSNIPLAIHQISN